MLNPKERAVLELIQEDPAYETYFFDRVDSIKWFDALKYRGYFEPGKIPIPMASDQEGYYIISEWKPLRYLEKLSEKLGPDNMYIDEILQIIRNTMLYKKKNRELDNYRVWYGFSKILSKLPNDKITTSDLEYCSDWLRSKFRNSIQGHIIINELLPKFLVSDTKTDIIKAEKLLDIITTIDDHDPEFGKKQKKLLIDAHEFSELCDEYIDVIGSKCSMNFIRLLQNKIRPLLMQNDCKISFEVEGQTYIFLLREREDRLVLEIYEFESKNGKGLMEILMLDENIGTEPTHIFYMEEGACYSSFVDSALEKITNLLPVNEDELHGLRKKLRNLYTNYYAAGTYQSFREERTPRLLEAREMLGYLLIQLLYRKASVDVEATGELLNEILQERQLFYVKLALYIIGELPEKYGDLFWKIIDTRLGDLIIDSVFLGDELKHILEGFSVITSSQQALLINKIESIAKYYDEDSRYAAVWKQERYGALSVHPEFHRRYLEMKKITQIDTELSAAVRSSGVTWRSGKSPISLEDIIIMTNEELVGYTNSYKSKFPFEETSVEGLANMLESATKERPEKFVENLFPFKESGFYYVYHLFRGLSEAWKNKRELDWGMILEFIEIYITRESFWKNKYIHNDEDWGADYKWVIGAIAALIREGVTDDSWAFDTIHLPRAKSIIYSILEGLRENAGRDTNPDDPMMQALNSAYGKTIEALILIALRIMRTSNSNSAVKWTDDVRKAYNSLLDEKIPEAFTLLGDYLPQLYNLDKRWVESKLEDILIYEDVPLWRNFITGYMSRGRLYREIYVLMREHYRKVIHESEPGDLTERAISHIVVGFLNGEGVISEDSLFGNLLCNMEIEKIQKVIEELYRQKDSLDDSMRNKVIDVWVYIISKISEKGRLDESDKEILAEVSKLSVFLSTLDEESTQRMLVSAPFVGIGHNASIFIEQLYALLGRERGNIVVGQYVGEIYLKVLAHFIPYYDEDDIRGIVDHLFSLGDPTTIDMAREICDLHGRTNIGLLRDIYEKYNL